ncbi:MAG: hypothetical protein EOM50_04340 [Erysipelotrichia bacterium]|nr:hypothetical protein [Erysipelotrichia bacterium]NCC54458.1 hypothetical protein [Erysipelotrichia bacterium]
MNENIQLLNFIYQNAQMGVETIQQLLDIVKEDDFRKYLKEKQEGYDQMLHDAKSKLHEHGYDEQGLTTFEKIKTYFMINIQTLNDDSTSHIAEMMMIGSTMGVINTIRSIRKYQNSDKHLLMMMKTLQDFEEKSYQDLKIYL